MSQQYIPQYEIVKGPSKYDLMLSLFDSTASNPRFVEFTVKRLRSVDNHTITVRLVIQLVEREDGYGESWHFVGDGRGQSNFRGHYNCEKRNGTLMVTPH